MSLKIRIFNPYLSIMSPHTIFFFDLLQIFVQQWAVRNNSILNRNDVTWNFVCSFYVFFKQIFFFEFFSVWKKSEYLPLRELSHNHLIGTFPRDVLTLPNMQSLFVFLLLLFIIIYLFKFSIVFLLFDFVWFFIFFFHFYFNLFLLFIFLFSYFLIFLCSSFPGCYLITH